MAQSCIESTATDLMVRDPVSLMPWQERLDTWKKQINECNTLVNREIDTSFSHAEAALTHAAKAGVILCEVRDAFKGDRKHDARGGFVDWVESETDICKSTAYNWIDLVENPDIVVRSHSIREALKLIRGERAEVAQARQRLSVPAAAPVVLPPPPCPPMPAQALPDPVSAPAPVLAMVPLEITPREILPSNSPEDLLAELEVILTKLYTELTYLVLSSFSAGFVASLESELVRLRQFRFDPLVDEIQRVQLDQVCD